MLQFASESPVCVRALGASDAPDADIFFADVVKYNRKLSSTYCHSHLPTPRSSFPAKRKSHRKLPRMSSSSKRKAGEPPGNPSAVNYRTFLPVNCIPADSTPVNLTTSASHTLDMSTATIPPELNQLNP
ncbi:hypothetical protein L211DRAFT_847276 [Terfezia boudieri ATCC MYA-4762]|uniref:Uncharacterized protein n=1 Tax=Terfezia boudieri ATCC MYA-4762 TaxID=1051890 RepID=A0A3N4LTH3_9PEZI|nr:hypothetical protein L211DRAFT_847276 [Terfezia boudieri ATCC MYA-4762]